MFDALLEAIAWFLVEVIFIGIFYWPGWLFLRTVTLGRYPQIRDVGHSETFVALVGFTVPLVLLTLAYLQS